MSDFSDDCRFAHYDEDIELYEEETAEDVYQRRERQLKQSILEYYDQFQQKNNKIKLTCRFDKDVLDWFKAKGKGYHTIINAALKAIMQAELDRRNDRGFFDVLSDEMKDLLNINVSEWLEVAAIDLFPKPVREKVLHSAWYDREIIDWFRSLDKHYQPLMNKALRAVMEIEMERDTDQE